MPGAFFIIICYADQTGNPVRGDSLYFKTVSTHIFHSPVQKGDIFLKDAMISGILPKTKSISSSVL